MDQMQYCSPVKVTDPLGNLAESAPCVSLLADDIVAHHMEHSSPIQVANRSLENLLASQVENDGFHTLVNSDMLPSITLTPTQLQLTQVQHLLLQANFKIQELEENNRTIHTDLAPANAGLLIKEEEMTNLQSKQITLKRKTAKANLMKTDDLKKTVSKSTG